MIKVLKRDQELVSAFLNEYGKISGSAFEVKEWVEDNERNKPAVEAIAVEMATGATLAIEHTLLQPYEGEKNDTRIFLTVIGELEKDASLKLPRYEVSIFFRVGAIPKGIKWTEVNDTLGQWIRNNISTCPDGDSRRELQYANVNIEMLITKMPLEQHETGLLLFGRYDAPATVVDVVRTAFDRKLRKLVGTNADKHILLFENDIPLHGNGTIYEIIQSLSPEFADLQNVDEIWLLGTSWWESTGYLTFTKIWPEVRTWVNEQLQ
jgi:hypothetical protein